MENVQQLSLQIKETKDANLYKSFLEMERAKRTFDTRLMTYLIDDGKHRTEAKEKASRILEQDPVINDSANTSDMSRSEIRRRTMKQIKRLYEIGGFEADMSDIFFEVLNDYDNGLVYFLTTNIAALAMRIGVNIGLFAGAIQGQGTDSQVEKYMPLVKKGQMFGCFAMTEFGNGSFIRDFETTATFDRDTDEFIINSPTITSYKWWIGMAAETATHCVCFARLLINDKDYGINVFLVPLRNLQTGDVLKGIKIGDVGPKMGLNGVDNGYIKFEGIRIPRENMLMKWASLSRTGEYEAPPIPQIAYSALLGGRVGVVSIAISVIKQALTIAVRYSAIRVHHNREQLLYYQSHQYKLMPVIAETYALIFATNQMRRQWKEINAEMKEGILNRLPSFHALSSALKAFGTWFVSESIEQCRQCCGGHGYINKYREDNRYRYSSFTGINSLFNDFAVFVTGEGDNTVISQQTSQFLFREFQSNPKSVHPIDVNDAKQLHSFETQIQLVRAIEIALINRTLQRLAFERKLESNKSDAWNNCLMDIIRCAKAFYYVSLTETFGNTISSVENEALKVVLLKLCSLFVLHTAVEKNLDVLLEEKLISTDLPNMIRREVRELCKEIRTQAVPLVDAFNFPDFIIKSPIGYYDGNLYVNYLNAVNKLSQNPKPDYFEESIKPLLAKL